MMKKLKQLPKNYVRSRARVGRLLLPMLVASLLFGLLLLSVASTEALVDEISGAMMDVGRDEPSPSQPLSATVPLNESWLSNDNDWSESVACGMGRCGWRWGS